MAYGPDDAHKSIYLHNDMANEKLMKFPILEVIFRLYRDFDALISVASSVADKNRRELAGEYALDRDAFTHCDNQIDSARVLSGAAEDLDADIAEWYEGGRFNFVSMAGSPRKKTIESSSGRSFDSMTPIRGQALDYRRWTSPLNSRN